jgi:hypothetical protein
MGKLLVSDIIWNEIQTLQPKQLTLPDKMIKSDGLILLKKRSREHSEETSEAMYSIIDRTADFIFNYVNGKRIPYGVYSAFPEGVFLFAIVDGVVEHVAQRTVNYSFIYGNDLDLQLEKMFETANPGNRPINFYYISVYRKGNDYNVFVKFDVEEHDYINVKKLNTTNIEIKQDWELAKQYDYGKNFEIGMDKYFEERKKKIEEQENNG